MNSSVLVANDRFGTKGAKQNIDETHAEQIQEVSEYQENDYTNSKSIFRKAKLLNDHLLLENGACVAHLGCENSGALTYALAMGNSNYEYIGLHQEQAFIEAAQSNYSLSNLKYQCVDFLSNHNMKFDAIILSDFLHRAYSQSHFSKDRIKDILEVCFSCLKPDGQILIKDYTVPDSYSTVILELPYFEANKQDVELFEWFAENVQRYGERFSYEEIESEAKYTRLFKMPYKWAYEFIIGRDKAESWFQSPPKEFTSHTSREYQKLLEYLHFRVLYMAPHRDEPHIRNFFHERFRILSEDGQDLGFPPTSFFMVAQKRKKQDSLYLYEEMSRRKPSQNLNVKAMHDEKTGNIIEIVDRSDIKTDIIPYRVTQKGRLNIFLTEGVPQCISNTLVSGSHNLDGRQWSGHMTQAIEIDSGDAQIFSDQGEHEVRQFVYDQTRLITAHNARLEKGPSNYPAPDYIDELKDCYYVEVSKEYDRCTCKAIVKNCKTFLKNKPVVKELDAQSVLDAINVGLLPNEILENQITFLMLKLAIQPKVQEGENIPLDNVKPKKIMNSRQILSFLSKKDARFSETRERPGYIQAVRSNFVDEGKIDDQLTSLGSQEEDFVLFKKQSINTAMVIPLTRDLGGEILAGFEARFLPVPQKISGSASTIAAPTFPLPKEVTTYDQAKEYVAKQFKVTPDRVGKLGESYFCHIDMTPHRIYPFVVASGAYDRHGWGSEEDGFTSYAPLDEIWKLLYPIIYDLGMNPFQNLGRVFTRLGAYSEHSVQKNFSQDLVADKVSNVSSYTDIGSSSGKSSSYDAKYG